MTDKDIAISVKNLGKSYRIWKDPSARLKAPLVEGIKKIFKKKEVTESGNIDPQNERISNKSKYYYDFRALKGVDLELRKGDSIGIIGRNGSGKSTLLQLIAGTLTPTEGNVQTKGRLAALLELGAGFNDEFTGRENVYLNGTILGLSKAEIDERFGRIEAFANIGAFIDQPIKTYSSGMRVRLAFAVQAEVDPDILIVDEALAVGDIRFTMKCIRRMKELMEKQQTTLLFVSHDLASIVNFCKEVIWIHDGEVIRRGDPRTITVEYSNFMHYGEFVKSRSEVTQNSVVEEEKEAAQEEISETSHYCAHTFDLPKNLKWVDLTDMEHDGNGGAVFRKAALYCPEHPENNSLFRGGEQVEIYLMMDVVRELASPIICCDIYDMKGNLIYGVNSCFVECDMPVLESGKNFVFRFKTELKPLRNGDYVVLFGLANGAYLEHTHEFGIAEALTFEVKSEKLSQRHHTISFEGSAIEVSTVEIE